MVGFDDFDKRQSGQNILGTLNDHIISVVRVVIIIIRIGIENPVFI